MKCPNCKAEIDHVHVFSECVQKATIDEKGRILEYESPDVLSETTGIECPECMGSLLEFIKEDGDGDSATEEEKS